MESDRMIDSDEARDSLTGISDAQGRLADAVTVPWGLLVAAGAAVAVFVADAAFVQPGAQYRASSTSLYSLIALLIIGHLICRETGIRFRHIGRQGWLIVVGLLVLTLAMFSVSLALVAFGLRWLVAIPVALTWGATVWGAGVLYRSCVDALRRA